MVRKSKVSIFSLNGGSGGGGGGEPSQYLKTIEKDEENKEIIITDKDDNEVSFGYNKATLIDWSV